MGNLSSIEHKPKSVRYCRTHAAVTGWFAQTPIDASNAQVWTYIAEAWTDLAEIRQRLEKEKTAPPPQGQTLRPRVPDPAAAAMLP